ncbi:hypothetical protein ACET3Z_006477 [Daucus carota]
MPAVATASLPVLCVTGADWKTNKKNSNTNSENADNNYRQRDQIRVAKTNSSHFGQVVSKDAEFLKSKIIKGLDWANGAFRVPPQVTRGLEWANEAFHVPKISKTIDDFIWMKPLEDPHAPPFQFPSWPLPHYPGLTGIDLLVADLKALEAYLNYFYYLTKMWTKPLPDVYDPQEVADYFNCRPHLVALRLLEVVSSFTAAAIKIRISSVINTYTSSGYTDDDQSISQYKYGLVLKETMLNLGPTFIKVGQSLSTRPDIIGSEITKALSGLHDQNPPFPRTLAMKIIEEELGSPAENFFSYISPEPVAAASFGQVYKGRTIDGSSVAVKVQRPNLRHVVIRDIYILRVGLRILQRVAKRKSELSLYADELGKGLVGELDYTLEAANASEFMDAHSSFPFMSVPKVLRHLTQKRVLTMEWMVGESPSDLIYLSSKTPAPKEANYLVKEQSDARQRLLDLVNKGVQATLVQLLETGLLHADPHPGNLRYTSSGQIGFLDFGLLCRMEKKHQHAMLASIVHIVNGDWASLVLALSDMDVVRPGTNMRRVTMDLEDSLGEVEFKDGIPDVKFSRVLSKIWAVAFKYHFRMPPYYTLLLRSLASFEGLAVAGDPKFKTFEAAYPHVVRKLLTDNSLDMRRILHSVVFNKKKEFQWKKLALFLRIGATTKGIKSVDENYIGRSPTLPTSIFGVTNLVLRLLQSEDGAVLRRLLMTVDGASLIAAMVSKEAIIYRQSLSKIISNVLYESIYDAVEGRRAAHQYGSKATLASGAEKFSRLSTPDSSYKSIMRDRRLKVIFFKILESARKDRILMLKFCWASFIMLLSASALACHRMVVSLCESYIGPISLPRRQLAYS